MFNKIKNLAKNNKLIFWIFETIFRRPIIDLYKSGYSKKVLFSYSISHFKHNNFFGHSNVQESVFIAEIFHKLGYRVDVVNNSKFTTLKLNDYNVIFGEGFPLYQALQESNSAKKIYYATGSHPFQCSSATLDRLICFYRKHGKLLTNSTRLIDYRWGIAASLADAVICIGNSNTRSTFEKYNNNIYLINPTYYDESNFVIRKETIAKRGILWFGSYGLIHKGLDLTIEAMKSLSDYTLHICGKLDNEKDFFSAIELPKNVKLHGFVDITSDAFKEICNRCYYVILPSCSEGVSTAVITAVARGKMIPLVTKECGIDIQDCGFEIPELNSESIVNTIRLCNKFSDGELDLISSKAQRIFRNKYTIENYKKTMFNYINMLVNE